MPDLDYDENKLQPTDLKNEEKNKKKFTKKKKNERPEIGNPPSIKLEPKILQNIKCFSVIK